MSECGDNIKGSAIQILDVVYGPLTFIEYSSADYGATSAMVSAVKDIKNKYQQTVLDYIENGKAVIEKNVLLHSFPGIQLNLALYTLFGIRSDAEQDVHWSELSWCAIPRTAESGLLASGQGVQVERVLECIKLTEAECVLGYQFYSQPIPSEWSDEAIDQAKRFWYNALMSLKKRAEKEPNGTLGLVLWQALVDDGRFPGLADGLNGPDEEPLYSVNDLADLGYPQPFNQDTIRAFLENWYQRTWAMVQLERNG